MKSEKKDVRTKIELNPRTQINNKNLRKLLTQWKEQHQQDFDIDKRDEYN